MGKEKKIEKPAEVVSPLQNLVCQMGFEICEWPPEPGDKCESCGKEEVQMYFCSDGFGEGCYWCLPCIVNMHKENNQSKKYWCVKYDSAS